MQEAVKRIAGTAGTVGTTGTASTAGTAGNAGTAGTVGTAGTAVLPLVTGRFGGQQITNWRPCDHAEKCRLQNSTTCNIATYSMSWPIGESNI